MVVRALVVCLGVSILGGSTSDAVPRRRATSESSAVSAKKTKASAKAKSKAKTRSRSKKRAALEPTQSRSRSKAKSRSKLRLEVTQTSPRPPLLSLLDRAITCPEDMVAVAGRVCVDRYELRLVDVATHTAWSPHYAPNAERASRAFGFYSTTPAATALGGAFPIPLFPGTPGTLAAVSEAAELPQGYMNREEVARACDAAGKRLCSESEWVTACMGEDRTEFPYGRRYQQDTCNVFRETHPSFELHGTASRYHDDPRNGLVEAGGRTLLLASGSLPACASRWGDDAIFDMVGNLDEWVDGGSGVFVGGFYSRGSRSGCYARISSHAAAYSDYSTGGRCCKDPSGG
jgi:hypothetical protein